MRISVTCDDCSNSFTVGSQLAGKRVKCPACGEPVRVPLSSDDDLDPPRRASSGRTSKKPRRDSNNQSGMMLGIGIGIGGMAVLCAVFLMINRGNHPNPQATNPVASNPVTPNSGNPTPVPAASPTVPVVQTPVASSPAPVVTAKTESVPPPSAVNPNPVTPVVVAKTEAAPTVAVERHPSVELSMTDLIAQIEKSVVRISVKSEEGSSIGSGFVIDPDGSIMTNYHVIEGAESASVEFDSGKKFKVIGFTAVDLDRDLAVIKIEMGNVPLVKVRVAEELPRKGEKVAAFGAPRGLAFTASDGIISAIRHCPDPEFNARKAGSYLQTTAPISPGNSGGPLVNMRGEVVGVNSFKMQGENLNFAASANDIREVIERCDSAPTPLSPDNLPVKYTDQFARAENLAGTTKGNLLLGRVRDVAILMLPFAYDPSGRVSEYVELQVEKSLIKKAGWIQAKRQSQVKGSTAFVVVLIYFKIAENVQNSDEKMISELKCRVRIVTRDVDQDGHQYTAIVWDEEGTLGTVAIGALVNGVVPDAMKKKISDFFNRISVAHRKAVREAESGK